MTASLALLPEYVVVLPREDVRACYELLSRGSKSFALAARLLPRHLRDQAAVFYGFCRMADDVVDLSGNPQAAVEDLQRRLECIYRGEGVEGGVERAFSVLVREANIPRGIVDALIEGFVWDAQERSYESLDDVLAYAARVASSVGVVMTLLMGVRHGEALARACDLGAAMQLTNIARDVAEDAQRGRVYLPEQWLAEAGLSSVGLIEDPVFTPKLGEVVRRLLSVAKMLYVRSEMGIASLPPDCRPAIWAARLIYADIGGELAKQRYNPFYGRAHVGFTRKLIQVLRAFYHARKNTDTLEGPPTFMEAEFLVHMAESSVN